MPINSTLQVAGFCMAVLALIMAMVTCSKYKKYPSITFDNDGAVI